jgi:hypothetical protein
LQFDDKECDFRHIQYFPYGLDAVTGLQYRQEEKFLFSALDLERQTAINH